MGRDRRIVGNSGIVMTFSITCGELSEVRMTRLESLSATQPFSVGSGGSEASTQY